MRFEAWEPEYLEILREFGFSRARDEQASQVLRSELASAAQPLWGAAAEQALRRRLEGASALLVGGGPGELPLPLPPSWLQDRRWTVVAADGATSACLARGQVPDVIVSDLDGDLPDEIEASRRGALMVVHAHGDNIPALRRWVREVPGPVLGTCAAAPSGGLLNPGGFTDGDRALFLAEEFQARSATLAGYDFDQPWNEPASTAEVKRRKLAWARRLVGEVAARGVLPVEVLGPGRTVRPFRAPPPAEPGP